MTQLVEIEGVGFSYNGEKVLENVDLDIFENDFLGIIGPNGGGKTTLLKLILGLETPQKGKVKLFNPSLQQNFIGYLPQYQNIDGKFPITVFDVVRSGFLPGKPAISKYNEAENRRAEEVLDKMGISDLKKRPIGELSGGQLQRVFLSRALVSRPKLLILDEPNTHVDNRFESELYGQLMELNKEMAILLVSHDVGTISSYVKTIACVNKTLHYHPSNIITPEQLEGYNCPIQIITHGEVPHTVLQHHHKH